MEKSGISKFVILEDRLVMAMKINDIYLLHMRPVFCLPIFYLLIKYCVTMAVILNIELHSSFEIFMFIARQFFNHCFWVLRCTCAEKCQEARIEIVVLFPRLIY